MQLYIISNRHIVASPPHAMVYELEDLFVNLCDAKILLPQARKLHKWAIKNRSYLSRNLSRIVKRTIGGFQTVDSTSLPNSNDFNILLVIGLNGVALDVISSIPDLRKHFDMILSYVYDCWSGFSDYCNYSSIVDHLFVPFPELQENLQTRLKIPVSVIPYGADVLDQGSDQIDRSIDVMSFGRIPPVYYQMLFDNFDYAGSGLFYFHQPYVGEEHFPATPYGTKRFDYQNRAILRKMLRRSKITLAFDNIYTAKLGSTNKLTSIHQLSQSVLASRWFEGTSAGCVVVGKRPSSLLVQKYLGWEDATIELPDDPYDGMTVITNLIKDKERLLAIHRRNYLENLIKNDWRLRIKLMLETLDLPIPVKLRDGVDEIKKLYAEKTEINTDSTQL